MNITKLQKLWDTFKKPNVGLSGTEGGCETTPEGREGIYVMKRLQTSSRPRKRNGHPNAEVFYNPNGRDQRTTP